MKKKKLHTGSREAWFWQQITITFALICLNLALVTKGLSYREAHGLYCNFMRMRMLIRYTDQREISHYESLN